MCLSRRGPGVIIRVGLQQVLKRAALAAAAAPRSVQGRTGPAAEAYRLQTAAPQPGPAVQHPTNLDQRGQAEQIPDPLFPDWSLSGGPIVQCPSSCGLPQLMGWLGCLDLSTALALKIKIMSDLLALNVCSIKAAWPAVYLSY